MAQDLKELKTQIEKSTKDVSYKNSKLGKIKLVNFNTLAIGKEEYAMNLHGLNSLLEMIKIPKKFANNINSIDGNLFNEISTKLAHHYDKDVSMRLFQHEITNVFDNEKDYIEDDRFIQLVQRALDTPIGSGYSLIYSNFIPQTGEIDLKLQHETELEIDYRKAGKVSSVDETFKNVISIRNSSALEFSTQIGVMVQRLICSNLSSINTSESNKVIITHKNQRVEGRFLDMLKDFLKTAKKRSGFDYLSKQAVRAMEVRASLHEVMDINNYIQSTLSRYAIDAATKKDDKLAAKVEYARLQIARQLHLQEIEDGYKAPIGFLSENKHPKFLTTASTPLSVYDAWNVLTSFLSNTDFLSDFDKTKGYIDAGNLISQKEFDMEQEVAPKMIWTAK